MRTALQIFGSGFVIVAILYFFGSSFTFFWHIFAKSGRPPIVSEQIGPRGTGLVTLYNPRVEQALEEANAVPTYVPHPGEEGEKAGDVYENVQVLGDVETGAFTRLMVNITEWVAAEEGCAACHDVADFADDSLYTKVVARRMLEMVRHVNANWTDHVADTGVTCYTCHRGALVPANIWFANPGTTQASGYLDGMTGPKETAPARVMTALPRDPMSAYLQGDAEIRVQSGESRVWGSDTSIKDAISTNTLMVHMAQSLGVNCNYCHNTRAFRDWSQSRPQRTTAWHGIRMVRDLNTNFLDPLQTVFPAHRLGKAIGDSPKLNCATCHNGVFKPLYGTPMAPDFPEIQ